MRADLDDLEVRFAQDDRDRRAAHRLRYQVFVEELGGDGALVDHEAKLERDAYDAHYDHLVLVDKRRDAAAHDHVVGVYRLLPGARITDPSGFYTATEYDLTKLVRSGRRIMELGRSCIHRAYRGGRGIFLMWDAVAEYVQRTNTDILFGVASFHGTEIQTLAHPLSLLHHRHLAPEALRVRAVEAHFTPMDLLAPAEIDRVAAARDIPALIKAYLRLGGYVGEGAFVDRPFNTTDICLVLDTAIAETRRRVLYGASK